MSFDQGLTLTYPGWEVDKAEAERLFTRSISSSACVQAAKEKLEGMKNKQRLFDGDRSHPDIRALDGSTFTYHGWQQDKEKAEDAHTNAETTWDDFEDVFAMMKKKEAIHNDRSSVAFLRTLDSFTFLYPGWEADKAEAERLFTRSISPSACLQSAQEKLEGMKNKQMLFEGDRSHPDLIALDSYVFTYEGWRQDKEKAELAHNDGSAWDTFEDVFEMMKRKEAIHKDRSSVAFIRALDDSSFSFPGWEADKAEAERLFTRSISPSACLQSAKEKLAGMKNKQRLFDGDRSHPDIRSLDCCRFTYQGWQVDKEKAEKAHTCAESTWETFGDVLEMMKKKEAIHNDRSSVAFIQTLDSVAASNKSLDPNPNEVFPAEAANKGENPKCAVCWEAEPSHAYIPCGHRCVCGMCASRITTTAGSGLKCPVCRGNAVCLTRIFDP